MYIISVIVIDIPRLVQDTFLQLYLCIHFPRNKKSYQKFNRMMRAEYIYGVKNKKI